MRPVSAGSGRKESAAIRKSRGQSSRGDSVPSHGHGGALACASDRITCEPEGIHARNGAVLTWFAADPC